MSFRSLLLLALLAAPPALAHGDPNATAYDPLETDLHAWAGPDGALLRAAPAAGSLAFPGAPPGGQAGSLAFSVPAPLPASVLGAVRVTMAVEVSAPTPGRDADGNSLEVALTQAGEDVEDGVARAQLPPLLTPGTVYTVEASVTPPGALYARGEAMGVRIRPLMVGLRDDQLFLRVGEEGTRVDFTRLRVPRVQDLGLGGEGLTVFDPRSDAFAPSVPNARVVSARVTHSSVDLGAIRVEQGKPLYVVLVGDEPPAQAEAEHERLDEADRLAAAHAFRIGTQLVRVHPGVGVALRVPTDKAALLEVRCEANCPPGGFATAIRVEAPPDPAADERSALIPPSPQRSTPATPTADADPDARSETPGLPLAAALGAAALVALARRSRRRS
ncbi:MAG TPA: hypothetical protein VHH36_03950 [Candidatus Thermoplasmatota archaeon]|nr:hypothetical protein [Candidatus Thermoplasmatota archaeon]